jgi:hypothetical protein
MAVNTITGKSGLGAERNGTDKKSTTEYWVIENSVIVLFAILDTIRKVYIKKTKPFKSLV